MNLIPVIRRWREDDPGRDGPVGLRRSRADCVPSAGRRDAHCQSALPHVYLRHRRAIGQVLAPLAEMMRIDGDVDVAKGIDTVLRSRLFHSEECRGRRMKNPVEYAIGIIRACELLAPPPGLVDLEIHLTRMGHALLSAQRGRLAEGPRLAGWAGACGASQLRGLDHRSARENERPYLDGLAKRYGPKTPEQRLDTLASSLLAVPLTTAGRGRMLGESQSHVEFDAYVILPARGTGRLNRSAIHDFTAAFTCSVGNAWPGVGDLSLGSRAPGLWRQAAAAAEPRADLTILVVVELTGGNDGLNTVVPHTDDIYHKSRPTLRVEPEKVLKLDDRVGLHPALKDLHALWESGDLAVIQGVGYPNPNRSHTRSMEIWQTGSVCAAPPAGWLGRAADANAALGACHVGRNRCRLR